MGENTRRHEHFAGQARELEIRISALFSSFDNPIGALHRFAVSREDEQIRLEPVTPLTEQLQSRRQRRQSYRWLKEKRHWKQK